MNNLFETVKLNKQREFDDNLFNDEFRKLFKKLENSKDSFFITGKAGTGKSTLLQYFSKYSKKKVVVLAPTGLAALNVGGQTIHSFFRFPPKIITQKDIKKLKDNKMFKEIDTIIIDEVSMVRADLFDGIDLFLRLNRGKYLEPFGGVQLILFGDLFQLPPVVTREDSILSYKYESPYFFDSHVFDKIKINIVEMDTVYRQKDKDFIELLDAIRLNKIDKEVLGKFNERVIPDFNPQLSDFITLTPTNRLANMINNHNLNQIPNREYSYYAGFEGNINKTSTSLPAEVRLSLKEGAKVIFTRNDVNKRWVNGSLGTVYSLDRESIKIKLEDGGIVLVEKVDWEKLKYSYDEEKKKIVAKTQGKLTQYPLKLAWALTIHKSQGQTFDKVFIDLSTSAFAHGQTYVALSRCTKLEGIVLKTPISRHDVIVDNRIVQFYE